MAKIPPRESVRENPLYRSAMAAQHAAYQLMRDVPIGSKPDAARLHAALVNATTWVTALVDPDVAAKARDEARAGLDASVAAATEVLGPLAPLANDGGIVDTLEKRMEELRKVKSQADPAA
jgi:hypothetical protein